MSILGKAARRRGQGRWAPSLGAGPAVAALLLAALGWVCLSVAGGAMPLAAPIAHADSNGSLSLVQPADPEGPVGANIVARIQNAGNNVTLTRTMLCGCQWIGYCGMELALKGWPLSCF